MLLIHWRKGFMVASTFHFLQGPAVAVLRRRPRNLMLIKQVKPGFFVLLISVNLVFKAIFMAINITNNSITDSS